ncbi:MAG TPA: nitroreductase family protein [Sedimentisphaerales bacterium]|nr:nitroreductase family protein [Sedimentisphaerales bacterium]
MAEREPQVKIADMFTDRWSPRAFSSKPVKESDLQCLFEAARWAPSCYNEQPWQFYYVTADSPRHAKFVETLVDLNQSWACNAPALIYIVGQNNFKYNSKANPWSGFDTGAAWMSLALQARQMDLYTHAMAGFKQNAAMKFLGLDKKTHTVYAAIAAGYLGDKSMLNTDLQEKEEPSDRISTAEFVYKIV